MSLLLPTSLGEALDKLNILELKTKKIKDENRLKYVTEEYNELYTLLKQYLEENKFYYNILYKVNKKIWDVQDDLRLNKIPSTNEIYKIILDENDRRCRIKNKINSKAKSKLREQKGYPIKKALLCSHLGLGDMICMIGIVRYLSTIYDIVQIICKTENLENVRLFYKDDDSIQLIPCDDIFIRYHNKMNFNDTDIYSCGYHSTCNTSTNTFTNIPEFFYEEMGFNLSIAKDYFYIDYSEYQTDEIVNEIIQYNYFFVHDTSYFENSDLSTKFIKENILVINPCRNPYTDPDELGYKLNDKLKNKPLVYFIPIIQNAKEIYCVDSSFFNLINFIDTTKVENLYVKTRNNREYNSFTKFKYI